MTINPRALAGAAELVLAMLLLVLFAYRRRPYVLAWAIGWALAALALFVLARGYASDHAGRAAVGVSKLLGILAGLAFVAGADTYRQTPRLSAGTCSSCSRSGSGLRSRRSRSACAP